MRCEECGHEQAEGRFCGRCGAPVGAAAAAPPPRPSAMSRYCDECGNEQVGGRFCGRCGAAMPDSAGGSRPAAARDPRDAPGTPPPIDADDHPPTLATEAFGVIDADAETDEPGPLDSPHPPSGGWSPRRRLGLFALAAAVAVVALGLRLSASVADSDDRLPHDEEAGDEETGDEETDEAEADGGATPGAGFAGPTDTVLLVDDGAEGVVVLDLDAGERHHASPLPGQRRDAERPFRLLRLGSDLVLGGNGEVVLHQLALPASVIPLGEAHHAVPAAEPDRVWLVDVPGGVDSDDGDGDEAQRHTWRLVEASGRVLHEVDLELAGLEVMRGVPGGLAVRLPGGDVGRYDLATGEIADYVPGEAIDRDWPIGPDPTVPLRLADVAGGWVAWCGETDCPVLTVTGTPAERRLGDDHLTGFDPDAVWISPAGDRLAAVAHSYVERSRLPDAPGTVASFGGPGLALFELPSGQLLDQTPLAIAEGRGPVRASWALDGSQLFYQVHDPAAADNGRLTAFHRWTDEHGFERVFLPGEGLTDGAMVALPRAAASRLLSP